MRRVWIVIIIVFIFVVVGAVYFYVKRWTQEVPPTTVIPITTIAPLALPSKYPGAVPKTAFVYNGPPVSLPVSMPSYTLSYPSNLPSEAAGLAKQLGFVVGQANPVPYVYDWVDNDKQLSYNSQSKTVSFGLFSANPQQSTSLTIQGALSTLTKYHFLSDSYTLLESGRQTPSVGEGAESSSTQEQQITIISYQATLKNQSYPFIFSGVTRSAGEIHALPDGRVVSFSFYILPSLNKTQGRATLSFDGALNALNEQKGFLAGLQTGAETNYQTEESPAFSQVQITNIYPALFYIEKEGFVPIYIIEGLGSGTSATQNVRFFLRASS